MTFSIQRRVEFRDTDAAGIVHFSAFFPMMEAAEHEFLRSLGISVFPAEDGAVTWPRVAASCDYLAAARFEDVLQIAVVVTKIGSTSIQYGFTFTRPADNDRLIARGSMTAVCCRHTDSGSFGRLEKTPIPPDLRQRLAKHQQ
jgi:acyl-CoA thioester hydrolase